jgi:hypothetical protein
MKKHCEESREKWKAKKCKPYLNPPLYKGEEEKEGLSS